MDLKKDGERMEHDFLNDKRFEGVIPLANRAHLSSPTPHRNEEMVYVEQCYKDGWLTTVGENINELEKTVSSYMGNGKKAVALVNGTAAMHLAVKLAAERIYHSSTGITTPDGKGAGGSLYGRRVFVSDMTFDASVNPVVYEGGEPVFIDSEYETWNMDPEALRKAFRLYPDTKIVIFVHLYGIPGKIGEIRSICREHGALLIEDAAESLGAAACIDGKEIPTGSIGDYGVLSFNGNKIITGSSGGMLIVSNEYSYQKAKKWSTQSREAAPWYEHEELGYNYRISNLIAGIVRGQWAFLSKHIESKKAVYENYKRGLADLPVSVFGGGNYWLSSLLFDRDAMAEITRDGRKAVYEIAYGKSSPTEVLEALDAYRAEGRPIWKPMHLQPIFRSNDYIIVDGIARGNSDAYMIHSECREVASDIFNRGLCLPSDNKMTVQEQDVVIDIIHRCFR